jgi:hypothetical protein
VLDDLLVGAVVRNDIDGHLPARRTAPNVLDQHAILACKRFGADIAFAEALRGRLAIGRRGIAQVDSAAGRARIAPRNDCSRRLLDGNIDVGLAGPSHRHDAIALLRLSDRRLERVGLGLLAGFHELLVRGPRGAERLFADRLVFAAPGLRQQAHAGPLDRASVVQSFGQG